MYEDEIAAFKRNHGHDINLDDPKTFNEKIVYKKLYDRNPLLVITSDKWRARDYIREKIGNEAGSHLVPLIWAGKLAENIPFDRLPDKYIIKPNNGSGRYILKNKGYIVDKIKTKEDLSSNRIIDICNSWFKTVHGQQWYEWAYSQIDPSIVIEELLVNNHNKVPDDYRFYMFGGKCGIITVSHNMFPDLFFTHYDVDWMPFPMKRGAEGQRVPKPKQELFEKILRFAEKLSQPFDFVRVDFFLTEDWFYFSEITHYPGSGWTKLEPYEIDLKLGSYWKEFKGTYIKCQVTN